MFSLTIHYANGCHLACNSSPVSRVTVKFYKTGEFTHSDGFNSLLHRALNLLPQTISRENNPGYFLPNQRLKKASPVQYVMLDNTSY